MPDLNDDFEVVSTPAPVVPAKPAFNADEFEVVSTPAPRFNPDEFDVVSTPEPSRPPRQFTVTDNAFPGDGAPQVPKTPSARDILQEPTLMQRFRNHPLVTKFLGEPLPEVREMQRDMGGGQTTPMDVVNTGFKFASVPPQAAEPIRKGNEWLSKKFLPDEIGGIEEGTVEAGLNFPIAAAPLAFGEKLGTALLGVFSGDYLLSLPEQKAQFDQAMAAGDKRTAYKVATSAILNGAILGVGGAHEAARLTGDRPVPPVTPRIDAGPTPDAEVAPVPKAPEGFEIVSVPDSATVKENGGNPPGKAADAGQQITTSALPAEAATATETPPPVKGGASVAELVGTKLDEIKALLQGQSPPIPKPVEPPKSVADDFVDQLRTSQPVKATPKVEPVEPGGVELEQAEPALTKPEPVPESGTSAAPVSAEKTLSIEDRLDRLKIETQGKLFDAVQGIPVAVWNTTIDGIKLAVRAGKSVAAAIDEAIEKLRGAGHTFDETEFRSTVQQRLNDGTAARGSLASESSGDRPEWLPKDKGNEVWKVARDLVNAGEKPEQAIRVALSHLETMKLRGYDSQQAIRFVVSMKRTLEGMASDRKPQSASAGKTESDRSISSTSDEAAKSETSASQDKQPTLPPAPEKPEWQVLKENVESASEKLRQAIHEHGQPGKFGKTKTQTLAAKNLAGAEYRNSRERLNEHSGYVNHLFDEHDRLVKELRGMSADDPRRSELSFQIESIQDELSKVDKRVVQGAFNARNPEQLSRSEEAAKRTIDDVAEPSKEERGKAAPDETDDLPESRSRRLIAELPGRVREVFDHARQMQQKLRSTRAARDTRDIIAATKDSADTIANRTGAQASNLIRHELNRAFGESDIDTRNDVREWALTAVIESGMDRETLADHQRGVEMSDNAKSVAARQWLTAAKYAERHWDRLVKVAETYKKITDAEVAVENEAGIPTLHRDGGYVFHMQDVTPDWAAMDLSAGGTGPAAPFKHIRDHATYPEAIASGVKPKTLNAVDLLQHRITLGRKLIGYRAWIESMGSLVDPTSDRPVLTEPIVRKRADGTSDTTAPAGYKIETFAGQTVAVHAGYGGLFKALTGESGLSGGGWQAALKTAQTIKHVMLVADTYHLGRLAYFNMFVRGMGEGWKSFLPGNPLGFKRGLTLLDNTAADIRKMAEAGDIPKEWVNDLTADRALLDRALNQGLNVGHAVDNMYNDWVKHLPIAGDFNQWLFGKFQRGAMSEASLIEMKRQANKLGHELTDGEVRKIARDLNTRFGNLGSQGWVKSRTAQDLARLFLLAPSWNESLIRAEVGAVKQIGGAARDLVTPGKKVNMGVLGRAAMSAVAMQFVANQVLNMATRGHPTWDNPEEDDGAKLSAWIPDVVGRSSGYFLNPLTLPTEISHYFIKSIGRNGDFLKSLKEFSMSRLQPVSRAALTLITREDEAGAKLRTGSEVAWQMLKSAVPLPLSAGAIKRAVSEPFTSDPQQKYPGEYQKQLAQTFGLKLDMAPTPDQRIRNLAKTFNDKKGIVPNAEFYHGDYYFVDRAALVANKTELAKEVAKLLEKKTPSEVAKHYDKWVQGPFTGSAAREAEFRATLNPEQRDAYVAARQKRQQLATQILGAVAQSKR